jgi:hypothetical protein
MRTWAASASRVSTPGALRITGQERNVEPGSRGASRRGWVWVAWRPYQAGGVIAVIVPLGFSVTAAICVGGRE